MPGRLRTSVVLAVVAAVLLGYILIVERGSLSSSELEQRKDNALPEFVRGHLSKLEIQRKGQSVVIERDPNDVDEGGLWHVTTPYRAPADRDTVDSLIGELEFLDARRRIEHVSAADSKRFGFDAPRYRVWFTVGKLRVAVLIGNESPRADGVYLRGADPSVAFVVGKDLVETLDHDARDYHTHELHEGVLVSTAQSLALHDAQGDRAVRKRVDGSWSFEPPLAGLASIPAISEAIEAVDHLRAKHFVAQDVKDLAQYGLAEAQFELRLRNKRLLDLGKDKDKSAPKGEPTHEEVELRLRAGKACADHAGESYLTMDDSKSVSCVADADLAKLTKSIAELREGRLLPFDDDVIASLRIEHGGRRLVLTKTDAGFDYEAARPGTGAIKGEARAEAVADWFNALRGTKAERFDVEAAHASGAGDVKLHIERTQNKPAYDLHVDTAPVSGPIAWREGEPVTLVYAAGAAALLDASAARVRKLEVVHIPETEVRAISIKRSTGVEHLARKPADSAFSVDAPLQAPADSLVLSELTRLIAALEAVRWVADAPEPAHGLGSPFIELGIEHAAKDGAKPARIDIAIGNETEGGRFAQRKDQPGVFVISSRLVQLLAEPLVSRTALSTPLEQITAVDLEQTGKRIHIERSGEQFIAPGTKLDAVAARDVVEALATLRASHVIAYGPASPEQGLQKPFARLSVSTRDTTGVEQHYTVAFGAEAQGGRYARREDRAVTFVVPKDGADKLLAPFAAP